MSSDENQYDKKGGFVVDSSDSEKDASDDEENSSDEYSDDEDGDEKMGRNNKQLGKGGRGKQHQD